MRLVEIDGFWCLGTSRQHADEEAFRGSDVAAPLQQDAVLNAVLDNPALQQCTLNAQRHGHLVEVPFAARLETTDLAPTLEASTELLPIGESARG